MTRLCLSFVVLFLIACGGNDDAGIDAANGNDGDANPGAADATSASIDARIGPDAGPATNCVHEVVATGPMCNADCDVRLAFNDGSRWCTSACGADGSCTAYSLTLTCATEIGTCMPRCTSDASCQALGFPRCHPVGDFCDTYPACGSDAQCKAVGYERCEMPGAYCV